ncbi:efflux RND transporter periplasmic adaptor subunit [Paraglaciecola polaris]|uniref:Efflux transporter, RND family, MFP subunit n=1 Tax=Paraglaciecola polaris LMG 21857 TaxID=1129793 RepID=K7AJ52_9ALTE|nr:efflux RND transporter periplasmic adaptor subunit [Paraglaciecola polaris]GAC35255.1 efflux transporter, RND family, MFP subunit [Paraglaciecola polaris LMG 21857]|tara:strand:+ start:22768 stop:23916 length:1149 start_codon:yes stop_codon:yes gene_type:complete
MSKLMHTLRLQPYWIALVILIVLSLWVASGMLFAEADNNAQARKEAKHRDAGLVSVRVERVNAQAITREINLYGRTEPNRAVTLRSEVSGLVEKIYVEEGQSVKQGEPLIDIETSDLRNRLTSAQSTLIQRQIELEGAKSLGQQGYQSKATLAQAQANLETAVSQVSTLQLAVEKSTLRAPFDSIVNERHVELGDLLKDGDKVAMLVDLDPLIIRADVTESDVQALTLGQPASGRMISGNTLQGKIRYVSSVSDMGTNTFKVEVAIDNPGNGYLAGMSTELSVPLKTTMAVRITPSVMALDEDGNLGVKTVVNEHVKFIPIDIVKSDSQGVWLGGMGDITDVITLGHGFVRDGDKVNAIYNDSEMSQQAKIKASGSAIEQAQ